MVAFMKDNGKVASSMARESTPIPKESRREEFGNKENGLSGREHLNKLKDGNENSY